MKIGTLRSLSLGIAVLLTGFSYSQKKVTRDLSQPVDYVNPYIGNISQLLVPVYPTVHLPNSLLRVYPRRDDYTDVRLQGLPVEVTSHREISVFNISPYQGDEENLKPVITYSYDQEKLTPYSYSVYLDEQQTEVNFGLSHQSAVYEFGFERNAPVYLVLNSGSGSLDWDGTILSGYQLIKNGTKVYLYLKPERLPQKVSALEGTRLVNKTRAEGENACIVLNYPAGTKSIRVRYGISFIDEVQARKNLEREVAGKSVRMLQQEGRTIWNKALGKISVKGGTKNERVAFYTALYRCHERPVCISEDGRYYSGFDRKVHEDNGRPFFTDDWLWDTHHALHPLRILLDPKKEEDILNSFVLMASQGKHFWMPTFPQVYGDALYMNCNHGVASVLDAHEKGLKNFDLEKAYHACKGAIMEKTLAPWSKGEAGGEYSRFYHEHGYVPALEQGEAETFPEVNRSERRQPVPVTLGTAYDQWCLSQIARALGKNEDADYFRKCSLNYRNLFNPKTGFFHPKDKDGNFIAEPFDYAFSGGFGARDYYDENNGWIYRWEVSHNIPDLIRLMGGQEAFVQNLDAMFSTPIGKWKVDCHAQLPDHTGNVGEYSMGNEPAMNIPYLYDFAGSPWKTQKIVRSLLKDWFRNDLQGIPGDEDGGGLSSFVVFSSIGFYPVTPGKPVYSIGSPLFEDARIFLENGNVFEVRALKASDENKYIQSAKLNGKVWDKPWITHQDIEKGGVLELLMGDKANKSWGSLKNNLDRL